MAYTFLLKDFKLLYLNTITAREDVFSKLKNKRVQQGTVPLIIS